MGLLLIGALTFLRIWDWVKVKDSRLILTRVKRLQVRALRAVVDRSLVPFG